MTSPFNRCAAPARAQLGQRPRVLIPLCSPQAALASRSAVSADIDTNPNLPFWCCTDRTETSTQRSVCCVSRHSPCHVLDRVRSGSPRDHRGCKTRPTEQTERQQRCALERASVPHMWRHRTVEPAATPSPQRRHRRDARSQPSLPASGRSPPPPARPPTARAVQMPKRGENCQIWTILPNLDDIAKSGARTKLGN